LLRPVYCCNPSHARGETRRREQRPIKGDLDFMAKTISCKDVGMVGCDFTAKADTVEELMQVAAAHAKSAHGLDSIPPELMPVVQAAVRDE
jgi:predicted small metal-binding protein